MSAPTMSKTEWERVLKEKRLRRDRAIADVKAVLDAEIMDAHRVVDLDDIGILGNRIAIGELSSEEVTKECITR